MSPGWHISTFFNEIILQTNFEYINVTKKANTEGNLFALGPAYHTYKIS